MGERFDWKGLKPTLFEDDEPEDAGSPRTQYFDGILLEQVMKLFEQRLVDVHTASRGEIARVVAEAIASLREAAVAGRAEETQRLEQFLTLAARSFAAQKPPHVAVAAPELAPFAEALRLALAETPAPQVSITIDLKEVAQVLREGFAGLGREIGALKTRSTSVQVHRDQDGRIASASFNDSK